jgi:hypothetical protein
MRTSESTKNITKAIISVMKEVKGIDKSMTVGIGTNSYKGVSDQDVKVEMGKAMEKHGLCLVPTDIEPLHQIDRWTESTNYGDKQKQSVFTSVKTKYLLMHESGEWIELSGYGHGVDTQDKAAGKATTYALKYTLLYTFLVPTGKIDDADTQASDDLPTPAASEQTTKITIKQAEKQNEEIKKAVKDLLACTTVDDLKKLKKGLPDYVKTNQSFIEHGTTRYNELSKLNKAVA